MYAEIGWEKLGKCSSAFGLKKQIDDSLLLLPRSNAWKSCRCFYSRTRTCSAFLWYAYINETSVKCPLRSFALESFMLHLFLGHYWVFFLIVVSAHSAVFIGDFLPHGKNFWNNGDFIRQQKTIVFSFGTAEMSPGKCYSPTAHT